MASPEARQILINDFGYQPVDIESKSAYSRAVKETVNKLKLQDPKDPRIKTLQDAVRPSRKRTTKKESTQPKKTKDDAVKFIRGKGAPAPVQPPAAPMPKFGGEKTGAALATISQNVNAIKKLVTRQNKLEKDKADDTREAREKKKRSMKENLLEGGKKMYDKVAGAFGKVLAPVKGIFEQIFNFITMFILGAGLMKILDWMGDSKNKSKITSIFRFLKDWWPAIVAALLPFLSGIPLVIAVVALAVGFLPKIIDTVKMLFGFGKKVDEEIAKNEKDLEKSDTDVKIDEKGGEDPPGQTETEEKLDTTGAGEKPSVQEPQQFNQGGEVAGQGNTDTVPAMLTPGEFVLTKEAVNQVGADTLYGMNAAAGGVSKPSKQPKAKPAKKKKKMKTSTVGTMMNMGGLNMGGMSNDVQYMSYGGPVQHMFMGGLVKRVSGVISKTPQARLLKFARNQIRKTGVGAPLSKLASKFPKMSFTFPQTPTGDASGGETQGPAIPSFDVRATGGRAKEQTLGIRR